jgi:hypothetical protein
MSPRPSTGTTLLLAVALLAALLHGWDSLQDPFFAGDPSLRVFQAERPVIKLGNRVWLPFLQLHIWLYHRLLLPAAGVKLISVAYLLLAFGTLGLYWRRILGPGPLPLSLAALAVLCFALQPLNSPVRDLMQEPVGYGLLFTLAWLFSRQNAVSPLGLAVAAAALLTRDTYWIYLFVLTLLHLPQLRSFAILWMIPLSWLLVAVPALYWFVYHRLPLFPHEWPRMTNPAAHPPSLLDSLDSLSTALLRSRVAFLAAGIALAALLLLRTRRRPPADPFASTLTRGVPLALLLVYGLILAFDPWQATPGNIRQAAPLMELCFLVAPLLLRDAAAAPLPLRLGATASILAALLVSALPSLAPTPSPNRPAIHAAQSHLKQLLDDAGRNGPASACFSAPSNWTVFREFAVPAFHHRKTFIPPGNPFPAHCQVILLEQTLAVRPPPHFRPAGAPFTIESRWLAYVAPLANGGAAGKPGSSRQSPPGPPAE